MGRHRRSDAGRATTGDHEPHGSYVGGLDPQHTPEAGSVRGIAPYLNPEAYAETVSRSDAYLFAPEDPYTSAVPDTVPGGGTVGFPMAEERRPVGNGTGGHTFGGHDSPTFDDRGHEGHGLDGHGLQGHGFEGHGLDGYGPDSYHLDSYRLDGDGPDGFRPDGGNRNGGSHRSHHRKKKNMAPVRNGLLGVSAAVAIGTVAVAAGVLPGGDTYTLGGGGADKVQSGDTQSNTEALQGGTSGAVEAGGLDGDPSTGGAYAERGASPSSSAPSARPTTAAPAPETPSEKPSTTPSQKKPAPKTTPSRTPTEVPTQETNPPETSPETAAVTEVLRLVNDERAKAGCSPLAGNSALADLAGDYSEAMAEQGFFDHTDPSGRTPWDRAEAAGIGNLGGENIARGQADAAAVMEAWMNSPGHRANILNCDFKTLGVGVQFGSGGPWWTQNFGY